MQAWHTINGATQVKHRSTSSRPNKPHQQQQGKSALQGQHVNMLLYHIKICSASPIIAKRTPLDANNGHIHVQGCGLNGWLPLAAAVVAAVSPMEPTLDPARIRGNSLHSNSPLHTPCSQALRRWGRSGCWSESGC